MKILFTGASSFTGYWFIKELVSSGHSVTSVFRKNPNEYESIRKERVDQVIKISTPVVVSFGSKEFISVINSQKWDLYCHHAAEVTNYKSPDFDVIGALKNNTENFNSVLDALNGSGCSHILYTGSYFEQNEGTGKNREDLHAFSPYGLSKGLTWEYIKYFSLMKHFSVGKFVIPNPFGPYENIEATFTGYLVGCWLKGVKPTVKTPDYFRDNIHVSLMGKVYSKFAENILKEKGILKINPSGYKEKQGEFAIRFAQEMKKRIKKPCDLEFAEQLEFPQPKYRVNSDVPDINDLKWDEEIAWDNLAAYYLKKFS